MAPQSRALPVLITRPEPQAQRFAQAVADRYGDRAQTILCPLIRPVMVPVSIRAGTFASVIFTSETGVQMARALSLPLPDRAYCVGDRTAQVATDMGFRAISAQGAAADLTRLLCTRPEHAPFLHLHGNDLAGDIVQTLTNAGLSAEGRVIYTQDPVPFCSDVRILLQSDAQVIVPLFSPRSARLFSAECCAIAVRARLDLVALSPAVALAAADIVFQSMAVAEAPTQADLMLAMDRYLINA